MKERVLFGDRKASKEIESEQDHEEYERAANGSGRNTSEELARNTKVSKRKPT